MADSLDNISFFVVRQQSCLLVISTFPATPYILGKCLYFDLGYKGEENGIAPDLFTTGNWN